MSMEVTDEMIEAYRTAGAHIAIVDREKVKVRLAAVLSIVEREHHAALDVRADAAYERGIADAQAKFSQEIAEAYTRGSRDSQSLTDLGF